MIAVARFVKSQDREVLLTLSFLSPQTLEWRRYDQDRADATQKLAPRDLEASCGRLEKWLELPIFRDFPENLLQGAFPVSKSGLKPSFAAEDDLFDRVRA